ncbi:MAG: serine/threonine protein kinase, partial [Gemmatimonadales bacterium]
MNTPRSPDLPRVPELDGEFDLVRRLGAGASGAVFLARDRATGAESAIKILLPERRGDEDAAARLVREARMLGNLEHASIVRLHGTRRLAGGHLALVLEFVRGRTVADLLATQGPPPTRVVHRVVQGIGEALAYLDLKRVVHRDLKPGNIHLDEAGGRVLLADFGIARNRDADSGLDPAQATHGTPAYMSPEQVDGRVP